MKYIITFILLFTLSCSNNNTNGTFGTNTDTISNPIPKEKSKAEISKDDEQEATDTLIETYFTYPTKKENYYIEQGFQDTSMFDGSHLGIDITKRGSLNGDLGDTIYALTNMRISNVNGNQRGYFSGIAIFKGKYIRVIHMHCDTIFVTVGQYVKVGKPIAILGNEGTYESHLHLEIASDTTKILGAYGFPDGFLDPCTIIPKY